MGGRWSNPATAAMAESNPALPAGAGIHKLSDSMCANFYAASLKCLDEANYDKSKCQDHFDAYKECKKQERELRLEANRKSKRCNESQKASVDDKLCVQ